MPLLLFEREACAECFGCDLDKVMDVKVVENDNTISVASTFAGHHEEVQYRDYNFLHKAVQEAYEGVNCGYGGLFGAVVVLKDEIVVSYQKVVLQHTIQHLMQRLQPFERHVKSMGGLSLQITRCTLHVSRVPCVLVPCTFLESSHWSMELKL
ncbi:hypothetical protein L7F22_030749 [Adiantum nelumboides]|nr:hypothetical protein [Adiantum nelumboides]